MKSLLIIGIVLLAAGVLVLVYQGITYTHQETVAQLGSVQITTKERKTIPLPPVLGATAVGVGVVLIAVGARRR